MQVHQGKQPFYLEYFINRTNEVLVDQLLSEQGACFIKKRNRNITIKVNDKIPVYENYKWMKLKQIVQLLNIDNMVNMDTRTVIAGLLFMDQKDKNTFENSLFSFSDINKWLTHLKTYYELEVN
tara:strand:+ start:65 stop:436 length:372 start_codon:yes stop_codon:yes gene_type:complete